MLVFLKEGFRFILGFSFSYLALEQTLQGRDGVTIPESVQRTCGYGTRGHGLEVNIVVVLG